MQTGSDNPCPCDAGLRDRRRGGVRFVSLVLALLATVACGGCRLAGHRPITRPAKYSVRSERLLVLSDFKLAKDHPLIQDLITLRGQVAESLRLTFDAQQVTVYLFSDQVSYRKYLDATYPGLPDRRAYFVGTPKELAVYTFWGDRIQEDLRHEYTHGLLHSALKTVPLWLDEGLAEYFEVPGDTPGTLNGEYATRLPKALANGWKPDVSRLERIEEFSQMQRFDYQESWAWMHFLMHSSPDSREVLLGYLEELKTNPKPGLLSVRLKQEYPEYQARFTNYVATLGTQRVVVEAASHTVEQSK